MLVKHIVCANTNTERERERGGRGERERAVQDGAKTSLACHKSSHPHPVNTSFFKFIYLHASFEIQNFSLNSNEMKNTSLRSFLTAAESPFFIASLNP